MFDLDGTLVDSNAIDSDCYLQALVDIFGFDLDKIDRNWSNYPHITDAGILHTLCYTERGYAPTAVEIRDYQCRFLELLELAIERQPLSEIAGAKQILTYLNNHPNYAIAIATGAWQQTAKLKLVKSGLADIVVPIACSDDARARVDIMTRAELRARDYYNRSQFSTITYVGDGVWDGVASKHLNYHFIGIGTGDRERALRSHGAISVFANYQNSSDFIDCLQQLDK